MRSKGTSIFLTALFVILSTGFLLLPEPASGIILTDYDIQVDSTLIDLYYSEGNAGFITLTLVNQCVHQLTISISSSGEGILTMPAESSIILPHGKGSIRELTIWAVLPYESPAGVIRLDILTVITRVDGAFLENGKERHAVIVVLAHRHHEAQIESQYVRVGKGMATPVSIMVNNSGNAPDFFSIGSSKGRDITIIPAVDFMRVNMRETVEYPMVVITNEDSSPGPRTLDLHLISLCDDHFQLNRTITIDVTGNGDEVDHSLPFPGTGTKIPVLFLISFLSIFLFAILSKEQSGRTPCRSPLPRSLLVLPIFLLISAPILSASSFDVQAQVVPEVHIVIENPSHLDVSPLTPDEWAVDTVNISITDGEPEEHVLKTIINVPYQSLGYVSEHRITANETITFPLTFALPKESSYCPSACTIFLETIERQGVPTQGTNEYQAGFLLLSTPYSLPRVSSDIRVFSVSDERSIASSLHIQNLGNCVDTIHLAVEEQDRLEAQGFQFSNPEDGKSLDVRETRIVPFEMVLPEDLSHRFTVIRIMAAAEMGPGKCNVTGATLVLVRGQGEGGGAEPMYEQSRSLIFIGVPLSVVLAICIHRKRTRIEE